MSLKNPRKTELTLKREVDESKPIFSKGRLEKAKI